VPKLDYLDFDVLIERSGEGYRARILHSPAGEVSDGPFDMPFSDLELENYLLKFGHSRQVVRGIGAPQESLTKEFGRRLFDALFDDARGDCLSRSLDHAQDEQRGLRLRLWLSEAPALADIPWEYLYDRRVNRFLSLSDRTPVIRYLALPEPVRPLTVTGPLRILVMTSSPKDLPALDAEAEWSKLKQAVQELETSGRVAVGRLEHGSLAALQRQLRAGTYHVLHFIGHGGWDQQAQDGVLALEDENGASKLVSGQDLGVILHDSTFRLAVLNACEGARSGARDPFAGVAQCLVQQGVPAVAAMQFEISDQAAITFARAFYESLADGYPIDESMAEARKMIHAGGNLVEWATPVLYLRAPDGRIFDVDRKPDGAVLPHAAPEPTKPRSRRVAVGLAVGAAALVIGATVAAFAAAGHHAKSKSAAAPAVPATTQGPNLATSDGPTGAGSGAVAAGHLCRNTYLGYSISVPDGLLASGDSSTFTSCQAFDTSAIDAKKYSKQHFLTVPVIFGNSEQSRESLVESVRGSLTVTQVKDVVVAGQPATTIEGNDQQGNVREYDYIIDWAGGRVVLVAQLLGVNDSVTTFATKHKAFDDLMATVAASPTDCRRSSDYRCGVFYWTATPVNSAGSAQVIDVTPRAPKVGDEVVFTLKARDEDASHIDLSSYVFGDGPAPQQGLANTDGCGTDIGSSLAGLLRCDFFNPHSAHPAGPWDPPQRRPGELTEQCRHVYSKAGSFKAEFGFRSTAVGSDVPPGHDPYGDYFSAPAFVVTVAPANSTTTVQPATSSRAAPCVPV